MTSRGGLDAARRERTREHAQRPQSANVFHTGRCALDQGDYATGVADGEQAWQTSDDEIRDGAPPDVDGAPHYRDGFSDGWAYAQAVGT